MRKNKKWMTLLICVTAGSMLLTGCMNTGDRVSPNAEPSGQPQATALPGLDFGQNTAPELSASDAPPLFDWLQMGRSVEDKINMISEIQTARVIVNGDTALVGVTFADEYQGEMTQRIHDMIAGEIQSADRNIRTVAVTAEEEDVMKINEMADRIAAGTPAGQMENEIDAIVRNMTTVQ